MIRGILGKKIGMTQIFDKEGNVVPVTVVESGPCKIVDLVENNGHKKVKLGYLPANEKRLGKAGLGFFAKKSLSPMKVLKEFESTDNKDYQVGQDLKVDIFKPGDFVDVSGISIGKGFQGGMKKWNWRGGGASHGSCHHRRIGSAGSSAWPSRTFKGHHMPGRMGAVRVTVQGLRVVDVDSENNRILIKGAVPGHRNALLEINRSKKRAFRPLDEKRITAAKSRNPMKQSKAKTGGGATAAKGAKK